jgi:hypothetical protein
MYIKDAVYVHRSRLNTMQSLIFYDKKMTNYPHWVGANLCVTFLGKLSTRNKDVSREIIYLNKVVFIFYRILNIHKS